MGKYHILYRISPLLTLSRLRLIIASEYDPFSILQSLSPYLAGSASIVVHSPYVQVFSLLFHDFSTLTTCPDCGRFTESATRVASIPWAYRHGSVVTALSGTDQDPSHYSSTLTLPGVTGTYAPTDEHVWVRGLYLAHDQSVCICF